MGLETRSRKQNPDSSATKRGAKPKVGYNVASWQASASSLLTHYFGNLPNQQKLPNDACSGAIVL